jgi:hypothetical protein
MARATNSFPVPLAPLTNRLVLVSATCETRSKTTCMGALLPMMLRSRARLRSWLRRRRFSRARSFFSRAFSTINRISSSLKGLVT